MSFQAMTWAVEQTLPTHQKMVLIMLANRTNHDNGLCFPSLTLLAEECGMTKRSIIEQIKKLEQRGMLSVIRNKDIDDINSVNKYRLNLSFRSKRGSLGVVNEVHQGSERGSLGVVNEVHQGSERGSLGVVNEVHPNQEYINQEINQEVFNQEINQEQFVVSKKTEKQILHEFGIDGQLADDFLIIRKAKKLPLTKTAVEGIKREADKARLGINEAIKYCIEVGWAGFNSEWYANRTASKTSIALNSTNKYPSKDEIRRTKNQAVFDAFNAKYSQNTYEGEVLNG
jgi:Helix-turn-helix domain